MISAIQKSIRGLILLFVVFIGVAGFFKLRDYMTFKRIIANLKAETRVAEVLVTGSSVDEYTRKYTTTIKFLEYDVHGKPLTPKYFTFKGNLIQFQTLVVRFDDKFIEQGHRMRGKSIYLFWKAFVLDGKNTQEMPIAQINEIPDGYKLSGISSKFERQIWERFWQYALDPKMKKKAGIKTAQIEAPGSVFVPGTIYTLFIEHDGGLRIDTRPIPEILK